jgi:hypothetical protein
MSADETAQANKQLVRQGAAGHRWRDYGARRRLRAVHLRSGHAASWRVTLRSIRQDAPLDDPHVLAGVDAALARELARAVEALLERRALGGGRSGVRRGCWSAGPR